MALYSCFYTTFYVFGALRVLRQLKRSKDSKADSCYCTADFRSKDKRKTMSSTIENYGASYEENDSE